MRKNVGLLVLGLVILASISCNLSREVFGEKDSDAPMLVTDASEAILPTLTPAISKSTVTLQPTPTNTLMPDNEHGYLVFLEQGKLVALDMDTFEKDILYSQNDISYAKVSPDGKYAAYIMQGGVGDLYILDLHTQEVLFTPDLLNKVHDFIWGPTENQMTFSRIEYEYYGEGEDTEIAGVYTLDLITGEVTHLIKDSNINAYFFGAWSPDGRYLFYSKGPKETDNVSSGIYDSLANEMVDTPYFSRATWSPEGDLLAFSSLDWTMTESPLKILSIESGEIDILYSEDNMLAGPPMWSPDGHQIAFSIQASGNWESSLAIINFETGEIVELDVGSYQWALWNPDGSSIVLVESGKNVIIKEINMSTYEQKVIYESEEQFLSSFQWIEDLD